MQQFEFQYQYQPDDLRAIRDANSEVVFSPASSISAAAAGFAACLLVLGAAGAWWVLVTVIGIGIVFIFMLAKRLNAQSRGNREYHFRRLMLLDHCVVETTDGSESRKSWNAFEECVETNHHFLLRHYQRIIALPKRVVQPDQMDGCRQFILQRIGDDRYGDLAEFSQWFSMSHLEIFRFHWTQDDARAIHSDGLKEFGAVEPDPSSQAGPVVTLFCALLVFLFFLVGFAWMTSSPQRQAQLPDIIGQALICVFAVSLPFLTTWLWRKRMQFAVGRQPIRTPDEEIWLADEGQFLVVGYPAAVARYEIAQLNKLYLGNSLIGFKRGSGPVNVIPIRALGNLAQAQDLLRSLHKRAASGTTRQQALTSTDWEESGNPYQPPSS